MSEGPSLCFPNDDEVLITSGNITLMPSEAKEEKEMSLIEKSDNYNRGATEKYP